jgi:CRISPR-associated protein Csb2
MSDLSKFDDYLKDDGPAALVIREYLMPVEGTDGVLFPATFAAGDNFPGGYNIDPPAGDTNVCLIDSVGSQANRIEPIFAEEKYAARWQTTGLPETVATSLRWLERQSPPLVVAPAGVPADSKYRLYVPDNVADKVAKSWSGGRAESIADYRTEKDVRPMRLVGEAVHYLFPDATESCPHFDILNAAARSITHLGWGVDMVVGDATILSDNEVAGLSGERWQPVEDRSAVGYRVAKEGTLDDLARKHESFLCRIGPDGFKPVPPLSVFRVVRYRRTTEPLPREFAAFSLLKPDASGMRSFDPLRRTRDVAGMMRHAVSRVAELQGWNEERRLVFVHGKKPDGSKPSGSDKSPDRFQYLPLPTVNSKLNRVESIRRALITAPVHCGQQIAWARRALAGVELVNRNDAVALLTILPGSDWVLRQYVEESRTWSTVTPVILPGYDDLDHLRRKLKNGRDAETQKRYLARLDARMDELLRKAFRQAGYSSELIEHAELDWRGVGFRPGVELASRFVLPENLDNAPRIHVRVRFPAAVRGPIAVGSGRFRGFGLFAKIDR